MDDLIESRQLRVFVSVARSGNMRQAARQLHLTPSAVSHALKSFEESLGMRLFERTTRSVTLSREGAAFLPEAERVLEAVATLGNRGGPRTDWRRGRLRLGASPTACQYLVPAVIREFKESFPEVTIQIEQGPAAGIAQDVAAGRIDLGLSPRTPEHRGLTFVDIARDELSFIVNPMHPWARAGRVNRAEIERQRYVLAESRSFTKRLIDEHMRLEGLAIQPFIEIGNEEVIKELVRLDIGVGIFPAWIASEEIARGLLVALPLGRKPPGREWTIFHRPQHRLNFAETLFVGISRLVGGNRIGRV
ncbi:MAG: LysR family transcriptional regulator [Verrucomicrobiota bacterium]